MDLPGPDSNPTAINPNVAAPNGAPDRRSNASPEMNPQMSPSLEPRNRLQLTTTNNGRSANTPQIRK